MPKAISKSKFMAGLQCQKRLYLEVYAPHERPEAVAATERQFDEGHEVGALARTRFPGGVLIDGKPWEFSKLSDQTRAAIESGVPAIYEASFQADGLFARIDILRRGAKKGQWDVIEVKKSTSVKAEHLPDIAFQVHLAKEAGLKVGKCYVMHINNQCIYPDLSNLFTLVDVTEESTALSKEVKKQILTAKKTLTRKKVPDIEIGRHCSSPYECPFTEQCWKHVPSHNVLDLPRSAGWPSFEKGVLKISELDESKFKGINRRIIEVVKSGKRFVDADGISTAIADWTYPLYFLDFESINPAIPRFSGTKPYEQIPFQFSCHVLEKPNSKSIVHFEFLHESNDDPREKFVIALLKAVGTTGSIVSYNKGFEAQVMDKCGKWFPKYEKKLKAAKGRLVDPMTVINKHVYDAAFRGSFSLKYVAPALLGENFDYSQMEVGGGSEAQALYEEMISSNTSPDRSREIRKALIEYCKLDTLSMVELFKWLRLQAKD
ncbi:MAG: DUF2779 domain-containing protein [Deltaproteobacteria bacterium]|nr:DUF2779 domain-containing protein [Deltaproteobacteria bacterium]